MKLSAIALATILLAAAQSAIGQTSPGDSVVNVPFPFQVAGKTLPAGRYVVKDVDGVYIRIFNAKTTGAFVQTHSVQRSSGNESKLVFRCYADDCFLAEVWTTGQTRGRELFHSRSEQARMQRNAEMKVAEVRPLP